MLFSKRYGYKSAREAIQKDIIDQDLKTELWNSYLVSIYVAGRFGSDSFLHTTNYNLYPLYKAYWGYLFKKPIDEIPNTVLQCQNLVRDYFLKKLDWFEIYDFIEITLNYMPSSVPKKNKVAFITLSNQALEHHSSAYRIINNQIVEVTSEQEIQSIEEALENSNLYSGVQQHLNQALQLMSDRQNPDYRNSIKESISAVESICKIVTNDEKATLGKALKIVEDKFGLHPALKGSLSQLYGYTSDGDGIRHALLEESNLAYIDAKFMLVACTNFINYLIDKTKDQN